MEAMRWWQELMPKGLGLQQPMAPTVKKLKGKNFNMMVMNKVRLRPYRRVVASPLAQGQSPQACKAMQAMRA